MKRFATGLVASLTFVISTPASAGLTIDSGQVSVHTLARVFEGNNYGAGNTDTEVFSSGGAAIASSSSIFDGLTGTAGFSEVRATTFGFVSSTGGLFLFSSTTLAEVYADGAAASANSRGSGFVEFHVSTPSQFSFLVLLGSSNNDKGMNVSLYSGAGQLFDYSMYDFTGVNPLVTLLPGELYKFSVGQFMNNDRAEPSGVGISTGFGSDSVAFTVTPLVAAVPEPATWAMMIAGFGLVGSALRRRGYSLVSMCA